MNDYLDSRSSTSDYLAIGGYSYVCTNILYVLVTAWLNCSPGSHDGVWWKMSGRKAVVQRSEQS